LTLSGEGGAIMPLHVDVVKVDWGKGTQTRVAQVYAADDNIKVDSSYDGSYDDVIRRPYTDRESGKRLEPSTDPERFVEQLHTVMSGSYLAATELHNDDTCLFREEETLALESA
jgi:hypothetical protein